MPSAVRVSWVINLNMKHFRTAFSTQAYLAVRTPINQLSFSFFKEPRAHHLWVSGFFSPVRRFFPLKFLPKSLSGGFSIDGLPCPKGLATNGLCMRIMAIIRSSVQVRWCVSFQLLHVTNVVWTAASLTNFTVHFFAHFLSNTYSGITWAFKSMPPIAKLYCLIHFGFQTSIPLIPCVCNTLSWNIDVNGTYITSPFHNHEPVAFNSDRFSLC